jgi:ABC-type antimicrobial peptide transport system permease subunit
VGAITLLVIVLGTANTMTMTIPERINLIGSLSGLYPALKVQSMPPVIALKYE